MIDDFDMNIQCEELENEYFSLDEKIIVDKT